MNVCALWGVLSLPQCKHYSPQHAQIDPFRHKCNPFHEDIKINFGRVACMSLGEAFYLQSEVGLNGGLLKSPMRPYPYVPAGIRHIEVDGFLNHYQSRIMRYTLSLPQKSVPYSAQTAAKLQSKSY